MTILLLKGYNNYFNRIRKSEPDITAYKLASTSYLEYAGVNFDMQDGIATSLVVGCEHQQDNNDKPLKWDEDGSPDYLICHEENVIKSRWFVNEVVKVRGGQYKLALKRDVLVDFSEQVNKSPCYIEKGWIEDVNNPLVLNTEGFVGNKQKQDERVLRDETNCAWLVGYLKKDISQAQTLTYTFPEDAPNAVELDSFPWANCVTLYNLDGTVTNPLKVAALYNANNSTMKFRTWYPSAKTLG